MTNRGFFMSFFSWILFLSSVTMAAPLKVEGQLGFDPFSFSQTVDYRLDYQLTNNHQLTGNIFWDGDLSSSFQFCYQPSKINQLLVNYNHPHFTSSDSFRILHRDYFSKNSISMSYHQQEPDLVFFIGEQVLVNNGIPSLASYLQVGGLLNDFQWKISGMGYDSGTVWSEMDNNSNWDFRRNRGQILVLEGDIPKIGIAFGAQSRSDQFRNITEYQKGVAFVLDGKFGNKVIFEPGFRYISPDFNWPMTKTKPYPADRYGFTSRIRYQKSAWRVTANFDSLQRIDKSRKYPRSNLQLDYFHDLGTVSLLANWQPNRRVTLSYKKTGFSLELRPDIPQIKITQKINEHELRLTSSSMKHHRIEYRYDGIFKYHLIYKLELPSKRDFFYSAVTFGDDEGWLQISYGESDDGRLTSKFDYIPQLTLAWGWSW